ncbi:MAG: hypothetical protein WCI27_01995 [Candidatus Omnitrophota bacterium]
MLNSDYKDILRNLLENNVRFLVVGAYAMSVYGYPRSTGDIDIWIDRSGDNPLRVHRALIAFGAPMANISVETFAAVDVVFQIGVIPCRIDMITTIDGVVFESAFAAHKTFDVDNMMIPFISVQDLIANKHAAGRPKDLADIINLTRILQGDKP